LYICCYHGTHTHLTAPFPGLPRWAGTRKVEPIWILLKQETVSGCGISWARCKSAPHSRQITMPAPHSSVFYRPDALPATQPTASKHWRHTVIMAVIIKMANWLLRKMSFQFSNSLNSIFSVWLQHHFKNAIILVIIIILTNGLKFFEVQRLVYWTI